MTDSIGARVAVLNAAWYDVERSLLEVGAGQDRVRIPTTWCVVAHPHGLVLVDTGVDRADFAPPVGDMIGGPTPGQDWDAYASLASLGLDPADVTVVVNTHLHVDHVGQNRRFPNARFVVRRAELDYALAPEDPILAVEYSTGLIAASELSYEPIEGDNDVDLFGDGAIALVATPGHSAGHQSVLVRTGQGAQVLLAGDALWTASCRDDARARPGVLWSSDAYAASRMRLLRLAEAARTQWVFTHEPTSFDDGGGADVRWVT